VYVYVLIVTKNYIMDYSQFQVKYINNPDINTNLPEISFTPDISNISYLNGEADSPVSLI